MYKTSINFKIVDTLIDEVLYVYNVIVLVELIERLRIDIEGLYIICIN